MSSLGTGRSGDRAQRVLLAALGTHGDILPVIAIAAALRAQGHGVRVAAPGRFWPLADRAGLAFHPIGTEADFARAVERTDLWRPVQGAKAMLKAVAAAIEPTYRWLEAEAQPSDLVVASTLALGARVAQERLGLSLTTLHLMPMLLESRFAPPRLPGLPLPRLLPARWRHKLGRGADRFVLDPAALPPLNAVRDRLGLAPVRRLRHWWHSPERVLLAVPDWYAPPQPDWPAQLVQVGFPLADTFGEVAELSPDLAAFLRAGPAPLAFTYGSAMAGAQGFFATAVEMCRRSGRRGILLAGQADEIPADLPPGMLHVPYAPLSRLLPACAALVHHGGVGTVAQALAAGCPQLIVPVAFDHADEAERVVRLGVGASLARRRFTADRAQRAVEALARSSAVAAACRKVQVLMRAENGVAAACEAILDRSSTDRRMPLPRTDEPGKAAGQPRRTDTAPANSPTANSPRAGHPREGPSQDRPGRHPGVPESGAAARTTRPSRPAVCLCMVVRDEAPVIRACLDSARPLIDAWVVVDTGSTDGTQDIVRRALADLPGTLCERPWRDFARTRSEALALARAYGTYSLVIEAEDRLDVPADYALPALTADGYTLNVAVGASLCRIPQLLRTALPWRYDGTIHESLGCEEAETIEHLPGPILRSGRSWGGPRDPETDRFAAAVIERALAAAPTPLLAARYTFQLAQRHRDCGETEKALARYLERADQGFWPDEIYVSLLEAGRLLLKAGRPLAEVLAPLERAMAVRPTRAEAPHAASLACRMHADPQRGTVYGKLAAGTPLPAQGLFLERWIYEYGALDEYGINAYWAGEPRDSLDASLRALASGRVPEDQRERVLSNARFAMDRLAGIAPSAARQAGAHALVAPRPLDASLPEPAPRVLLAILVEGGEPVLPLFLACIDALDYPKSAIVLSLRTHGGARTREVLGAWLDRVGGDYAAVDDGGLVAPVQDAGVDEGDAVQRDGLVERRAVSFRHASLAKTAGHGCAYYFTADCNAVIRPCTLRNLVATGLPIVAPLLRHIDPTQLYSNYHAAIDDAGYFKSSALYEPVLFRDVTGLIEMPVVRCTYLVRADVIPRLGHADGPDAHEYVVFSRRARAAGIAQYFDNRQVYGYIVPADADPARVADHVRQARRLLSIDGETPPHPRPVSEPSAAR